MASTGLATKPHAICVPAPFQSHIKSMLKLAKLLHHKAFHITFVNTEFNHGRLLKSTPKPLQHLPSFRFETIPDGLPPSDTDGTQDVVQLGHSMANNFLAPFNDLIAKLNHTASSHVPPVTCIVSDGFMPFTITAAEMAGLPIAMFFTISACSFMGVKHFSALKEKGLVPPKDERLIEDGSLDRVLDWIPGLKGIRLRDLLSFSPPTDSGDFLFNFSMDAADKAPKASAIILHTFNALEKEVLDALVPMFPGVYAIGPLQLLLNQIEEEDKDGLNSIGYNLWKEETDCLRWLDSRKPKSVVYVNFGSVAVMTEEQLIELGMGLARSNHPFLWIIRRDIADGHLPVLPGEFLEETRERGFIAHWCAQEEVLNHPSIGCFLTHCGWNSTVESISSGVPMLCCPQLGDQSTNFRYTCNEWGIGMEIDKDLKRENVERVIREVMDGEGGKKLQAKSQHWKKAAEEASTYPNGSSFRNLDKLVKEVLLSN